MSRINQHFTLPDGRVLGYDDYGPTTGKPLFYFHGTPSSRLEWQMFGSEQLATALHLRVISVDRPGMGLSDFQPARRLGDWPTDVIALADRLDIGRFAVLGYSGGGPYAVVCALAIPERLSCVGMVSGAGNFSETHSSEGVNQVSRRFFDLCRDKPMQGRLMLRLMGAMAHHAPQRIIKETMAALPMPDQEALARPEVQRWYLHTLREAQRRGPHGAQYDTALMVSPWPFHPQEITLAVHLWHGEADRDTPIAMGRSLAAAIPRSQAHFYAEEGHLSLFANHLQDILAVFAADAPISV